MGTISSARNSGLPSVKIINIPDCTNKAECSNESDYTNMVSGQVMKVAMVYLATVAICVHEL